MDVIKYPRTPHLPQSKGATSDDKILKNIDHFIGKFIVITEKMDGENFNLYNSDLHARSITYSYHPSRTWIRAFHSQIKNDIPDNLKLCGENLFAKHSIHYTNLESYFLLFGIQSDTGMFLSWNDVEEYAALLNVKTVPVLYKGLYDESIINDLQQRMDFENHEGFVVRIADEFSISDFGISVAKFVRENHVQTDQHWMHSEIIYNELK